MINTLFPILKLVNSDIYIHPELEIITLTPIVFVKLIFLMIQHLYLDEKPLLWAQFGITPSYYPLVSPYFPVQILTYENLLVTLIE